MRTRLTFVILFLFALSGAQNLTCPSPYIYMDGPQFIRVYDPSQPISANNPSNTNIPVVGTGLALMPSINGSTFSPTFYTTLNGTYWYWNGTTWVNTNHSTGNGAAVNIAGCSSAIYNLVGGTGQVYVYNGTGNGTLLTTLPNFNGGGPYDLVTDCNCNFYALNTTAPNQALTLYGQNGQPQCTYSMTGMPNTSSGGGFAIVGNYIYVRNNVSSPGGFYIGEITPAGITFSMVPGFPAGVGDFASCPACYGNSAFPPGASATSGVLGCTTPTTNVTAISPVANVTYTWSGPSIISAANTSVITVSQAGVYNCTLFAGGCPPTQTVVTAIVSNNSVIVSANISPSGNICMPAGGNILLNVSHTYTNDFISWSGAGFGSSPLSESVIVTAPGVYMAQVVDPYTGCTGVDMVTVTPSPTVALTVSDFSFCTSGTGGSPASVTITPSGASSYTFRSGPGLTTTVPNGTSIPVTYLNLSGNLINPVTGTLVGKTATCLDSTVATLTVVPNPTLSPSAQLYTICPTGSQNLSVSGAKSYTWAGGNGLSAMNGSFAVASPTSNSSYTISGSNDGCLGAATVINVNIQPVPSLVVTPTSATICAGKPTQLMANTNATSFTWTPATSLSSTSLAAVVASPSTTTTYSVIVELNTCRTESSVKLVVVQPPQVSLAVSSSSLCAINFNNSPNTTTLMASGTAVSYSIIAPSGLSAFPTTGPVFNLLPVAPFLPFSNVVTATVVGIAGVCTVNATQSISIVPNPSIQILPANANICPGQVQSFTATGANSYNWAAGGSYTVMSPDIIAASPTVTSFYSVYGNSNGCHSDSRNAVLVVNPVPMVSATAISPTVCAGNSGTLTAAGNAAAYTWYPAQVLSTTNGTVVVASPAATQNFTVVAALNGCTNQAVTSLSVITIPVISAAATEYTVCRGKSTQVSVSGAQSYAWYPSSTLSQPGGNLVIATPAANTNYTVRGFNGICTASTSINIYVLAPPELDLRADQAFICQGSAVRLYCKGAQLYKWSPPGSIQLQPGDSVAFVSPTVSTNYNVTGYTFMGTVSCNQTQSYSVIVLPFARAVIDAPADICAGEKTRLTARGGNTYSWSPPAFLNSVHLPAVIANPPSSIIYTVEVSKDGACGSTATVAVNVYSPPSVTAGRDTVYKLNEEMWINATGTGQLRWVQGEGISCSECPQTRVYATRNGCYFVEAVSDHGCVATDRMCITVEDDFSIYIPNSFTPDKDGLNDVFLIYGEGISKVTMDIFDRWGARIFSSNDPHIGWDGSFMGKPCQQGVYTYVVTYYGLDHKYYSRTGHVTIMK